MMMMMVPRREKSSSHRPLLISYSFFPLKCCLKSDERKTGGAKQKRKINRKISQVRRVANGVLVLSTPTRRSKTAKQRQRERKRIRSVACPRLFSERERKKKTFRVAHDTLNKIEIFFLFWSKRETCAASFASCTRQTSGGFLLPFANTVYEEREARIRTLL